MNLTIDVILLALLQGIAEFLPISSSGHLVIAQKLIGLHEEGIHLEVALHAGTLISVIFFYREPILRVMSGLIKGARESWMFALNIVLAAIPAVLFYALCHKFVDNAFKNVHGVGASLIFTGCILSALRLIPIGKTIVTPWRAMVIGIAQAIAILPGVSRSGMTIASARFTGVSGVHAAEFSFLVSIPLIAGATGLELIKSLMQKAPATDAVIPFSILLTGAIVAGITGYFALVFLVRLLRGGHFWLFGPYCILAGLATLLFL